MLPTDTGRRDVQTDPLDIPSPEGSPSSMRPPRSLGGRESVAQQLRRVSYAAIGKTNDACGAPRSRGDSRASSERRVQALEKKMHERDLQWVRRCEAQTAEIRRLHEEAQVARLQADEEVRAVRDWYRRAQYSQSRPDLTIRSLHEELAHSLASNAQLSHHIQTLELQLLVQVNAMKAALPPQQLVVRYYCPDGGGGGGGSGGGDATATPTSVPYYARYSPVDLMEGTYKPPGGGRVDASSSGRHRQASPTPPPAAAPQPPPAPLSAVDADGPVAAAAAAVPATPPGLGTSGTSASTRGSSGGGSCGSSAAAEDSDPGYGGAAVDAEAAGGSVVARVGCPVRFFSAAPPRGAPTGLFSPPAPEIEDASSATEAAAAAAQASVAEKYANPYYRAASDGAAPPPHLAELAQRVPQLSDLSRALLDDGRVGDAAVRSLAEQASTWQARLRSLVTTGGSGSGGTTTPPPPPPLPPSQKRPSSSERQRLLPILSPPQQCKTSGYSRHSGVFRELDDCRNNADTFQAAAAAAAAAGGAHHHNHNHHRHPSPPPRASGSGGGGGGGGRSRGVVRSLSPNGVRVPAATPAPAPSGEGGSGSGSGVYGGEHAPHSLSRPSAPQPPQPREGSARAPPRDAGVRLPLLPRLPSASGGGGGGGGARGCGRKKKGCAATVVSQALLGQRKLREQNKVLRGLAGFGAFASSGGRPSSPLRGLAAAVKRATVEEEVRGFDTQTFSAGVLGGRGAE